MSHLDGHAHHHSDGLASLTEEEIELVIASLVDGHDLNRARTRLLHASHRQPDYWATLYRIFTGAAGQGIEIDGPGEWLCLTCQLKSYSARGLLTRSSVQELVLAQTRTSRRAAHFAEEPLTREQQLFAREPRTLVGASYALARDLSLMSRHPERYGD